MRLRFWRQGTNSAVQLDICKVKIAHIGKNLACTEKPEGNTDEDLKYEFKYYYSSNYEVNYQVDLDIDGLTNYGKKDLESNMYADDDSIEILIFFQVSFKPSLTLP